MATKFIPIQDDPDYIHEADGSVLVCEQIRLRTNGNFEILVTALEDTESAIDFNRTMAQAIRFMQSQLKETTQ